ncbi:predicted protein [Aspergillus terreus NIH2624]|uniref:MADS-box domain-containing protein n=1 Tax=Aspergillus terreus (strain NIH 2624 / FGSC A1156) TaxID=341663 RepID=Q0C8Q4_ASPTN|nr:uncharacterized protein ATEG_09930 [Aspergillus terreus NIH2624]EAU30121.1 predicted protein [Aspergillus terreus NIH2624]
MVKNFREKVKRRKERIIKSFHEFGLLSGAKMYLLIQDGNGDMTEYRNTSDRKFPPIYNQLRRLFPTAQLLTPESFGAINGQAETRVSSNPPSMTPSTRELNLDLDLSQVGLLHDCDLFPMPCESTGLPGLPSEWDAADAAHFPMNPGHPAYEDSSNRLALAADGSTGPTESRDYTVPLM